MNYYKAKKHTDKKRLNFLERNELHVENTTFFTVLTQHVTHYNVTLRDFCDFGIEIEHMYRANNVTHEDMMFRGLLESKMMDIWFSKYRPLNKTELDAINIAVDAEEEILKLVRGELNRDFIAVLTTSLKQEEQHANEQK